MVSKHSACINFTSALTLCAGDDLRAAGHIRTVCAQEAAGTLGAKDIFSVEFVAAMGTVVHSFFLFADIISSGIQLRF
jgi:hypothetical protein